MIELARHIEILLLENDCVIIPDFGGFIAHYQPARYIKEEKSLSSPCTYYWFQSPIDYKRWFISSIVYASPSHRFS